MLEILEMLETGETWHSPSNEADKFALVKEKPSLLDNWIAAHRKRRSAEPTTPHNAL
jgi:hypothetical protein